MCQQHGDDSATAQGGSEAAPAPRTFLRITLAGWAKLLILATVVVLIVLGLTVWDFDKRIASILQWLDENKVPGAFIFVAIYALLTAILFPSSILTLAGGAVFGFLGILLVWVGASIGQCLAFLVSRYLLRSWVEAWSRRFKVWSAIDSSMEDRRQALTVIILIRLATLIPYSVANALLPLTAVSFFDYSVGSAVGIIPGVILFTLIGRLASSIAEVAMGKTQTNPAILISTVVVSILVMVVLVYLLTRFAKKALAAKLELEEEAEELEQQAQAGLELQEADGSSDGSVCVDVKEGAVPGDHHAGDDAVKPDETHALDASAVDAQDVGSEAQAGAGQGAVQS